jgi:hypothetical protein
MRFTLVLLEAVARKRCKGNQGIYLCGRLSGGRRDCDMSIRSVTKINRALRLLIRKFRELKGLLKTDAVRLANL